MKKGYLQTYTTSLITGATKGIGYEFAKLLAEMGKELILISRDNQRLAKIQSEFEDIFGIKVHIFPCDLTVEEDVNRLLNSIGKDLPLVDLLINNAGMASYGRFDDVELAKQMKLVQLNVSALIKLTHMVLPEMVKRRRGGILNVASTSGFMSIPFTAVYSATKAFVINFSQALAREVRKENIVVSCLCPGATDTDFWKASKMEKLKERHKGLHDPREVAEYGLSLIDKSKNIGIPGFLLKVKHCIRCCTPDKLITHYMYHHMRPRT